MEAAGTPNIPIARSGEHLYENERPDLVALVPVGAGNVLDVGCGHGQLGAALKQRGVGRVVGIELNPVMAAAAAERLDDVLTIDVEQEDLPFADGSFDCVVYGDVLEHLVDPWAVLRSHRRLVAPGGTILVSTPNIAYWRVAADLLRGRWEYRDYGTMDATHLRFFTRATLIRLCEQAGFRVTGVHTPIPRGSKSNLVNRVTGGRLEHLLVWRYVIEATPA